MRPDGERGGRLQTFSKIETGDHVLDRVQDRLTQTINPLASNTLLSSGLDERRCVAISHIATAQAVPDNTDTVVNFNAPDVDTDRAVVPGSNWAFTIPANKAGYYFVSAGVPLANAASVYRILLSIFRNGVEYVRLFDGPSLASSNDSGPCGARVVRAEVGERLSIVLRQISGGSINTTVAAAFGRCEFIRLTGA